MCLVKVDGFHDVLESLGKAICNHHHSNLSPMTPDIELERHRVMFIGLAVFTVRLLDMLVPRNLVHFIVFISSDLLLLLLTMY